MKGTFKIEIGRKVTEQQFIEGCLNMKYSGYGWKLAFFFYALGRHWHLDNLNH